MVREARYDAHGVAVRTSAYGTLDGAHFGHEPLGSEAFASFEDALRDPEAALGGVASVYAYELGPTPRAVLITAERFTHQETRRARVEIFFEYTEREGSNEVLEIFRGFSGYVQADAKSVCDILFRDHRVDLPVGAEPDFATRSEVACWYHARRGFWEAAIAANEAVAREALFRIGRLFDNEAKWRDLASVQRKEMRDRFSRSELDASLRGASWLDGERLAISHEGGVAAIEIHPIDGSPAEDWLHSPVGATPRMHSASGFFVDLPQPLADRRARGSVYRSRPATTARVQTPGAPVIQLALDEQRQRILIATPNALRIFGMDGREIGALALDSDQGGVHSGIVIAPDGALATVTTNGTVLFAEPGGDMFRIVAQPRPQLFPLLGIALSRDGDVIFAGTPGQGIIRRWSRTRGLLDPLQGHRGTVLGLSMSPDGRTLASASLDGTVRRWDLANDRSSIRDRRSSGAHVFPRRVFARRNARRDLRCRWMGRRLRGSQTGVA